MQSPRVAYGLGRRLDMTSPPKPRRVIKTLDSRFVVPNDIEPIRILTMTLEANNDGGTGSHYVYHVLCEEVDE